MKKLTKLGISPEKIMKNEELINLQGGYGETWCCFCYASEPPYYGWMAMGGADDEQTCQQLCNEISRPYKWVC